MESKLAKKLLESVKFKPIPNYGNLMTLDDFIVDCEHGAFNNGHGKYAFKDRMSDKYIYPSEIEGVDGDFTHVVWFNK